MPSFCCDAFEAATIGGTDSEGYGALLSREGHEQNPTGPWIMGSELRPLKLCPWCGANLIGDSPLMAAAKKVVGMRYGEHGYDRGDWDDLVQSIVDLAGAIEEQ